MRLAAVERLDALAEAACDTVVDQRLLEHTLERAVEVHDPTLLHHLGSLLRYLIVGHFVFFWRSPKKALPADRRHSRQLPVGTAACTVPTRGPSGTPVWCCLVPTRDAGSAEPATLYRLRHHGPSERAPARNVTAHLEPLEPADPPEPPEPLSPAPTTGHVTECFCGPGTQPLGTAGTEGNPLRVLICRTEAPPPHLRRSPGLRRVRLKESTAARTRTPQT